MNNTRNIGLGVLFIIIIGLGIYAYTMMPQSSTPVAPAAPAAQNAAPSPSDYHINIYTTRTDPSKGTYMTDFEEMTLYVFDKDTQGVSNCYDACAAAWRPYISGAAAQGTLPNGISLVTRTDGTQQFAWKGMPLYYYTAPKDADKAPGDTHGDGKGGIWHIVKM